MILICMLPSGWLSQASKLVFLLQETSQDVWSPPPILSPSRTSDTNHQEPVPSSLSMHSLSPRKDCGVVMSCVKPGRALLLSCKYFTQSPNQLDIEVTNILCHGPTCPFLSREVKVVLHFIQ
mmetsp:Transcript_23914/g.51648  ORF Transcript_23914/g.51648 Transcript_23914/m.51648 type:complete len:122 (-) Transcript_23914:741-1106(-)